MGRKHDSTTRVEVSTRYCFVRGSEYTDMMHRDGSNKTAGVSSPAAGAPARSRLSVQRLIELDAPQACIRSFWNHYGPYMHMGLDDYLSTAWRLYPHWGVWVGIHVPEFQVVKRRWLRALLTDPQWGLISHHPATTLEGQHLRRVAALYALDRTDKIPDTRWGTPTPQEVFFWRKGCLPLEAVEGAIVAAQGLLSPKAQEDAQKFLAPLLLKLVRLFEEDGSQGDG